MKYWYQKNLRFLQTVLRAVDIVNYDAKGVMEYMKKANANVLVVNAGGVMDFFDNPLEMAKPNPFMKDGQDILKDVCDELHKNGMYVIVRIDFRGVEEARYNLHPDWFAKDIHGNPKLTQYATETFRGPCYLSYYANEHGEKYVRYLMSRWPLDGIWENAVSFGTGICYCERCRARYKRDMGKELPVLDESGNTSMINMFAQNNAFFSHEFDEYRAWKAVCADEHIERIRRATKEFGEDKAYSAEIFDIYNNMMIQRCSIDHSNAKKSFDYLISCVFMDANYHGSMPQGHAYHTINNAASTIRFSRALMPEKQPVINTGGNGTRFRYVCDPLVETREWLWEIASVGGGVWNCYFNGQHPAATLDNRAAYSEKDAYGFMAANSDVLSDSVPVKDVGLFYSIANLQRFGNANVLKDEFRRHFEGAERVLNEHHIPYNFVLGGKDFSAESLKGVKTLILPNASILTENEQQAIREYVQNGGGLVATYESSLYGEDGQKLGDYALADVLGVHYAGESKPTDNDYYFKIKHLASPVLNGIENTEVMMNAGATAICKAEDPAEQVAGYLPMILNQPPEYAWIPEMDSPYAGIVARTYGKGRVVYFANTADAQCYINGHEDFTEVLANAIDYTSGKDYSQFTNAYRSVHVNLIENTQTAGQTDYVVSLINLTGTQQRPVKEIVPVSDQTVCLPLKGRRLLGSKVLWGSAAVSVQDGNAVVTVERLEDFASVQLTLA